MDTQEAPPKKKHARDYTPEELGIDPQRDQRMFFALFMGLVILLVIGAIILVTALLIDLRVYEENVPDNPNSEFVTDSAFVPPNGIHAAEQLTMIRWDRFEARIAH